MIQSGVKPPHSKSKTPGSAGVASLTHAEVISTESTLAIMTSHATLCPASRVMIQRLGRTYLPALRHACFYLVTFVAGNLQMFRVTETDAKCRHEFRRARIPAQLMTCAARRNITAAGLRSRSMTSITSCVGIEPGRNRHCNARARRPMTTCATDIAHGDVSRMIELHAKALQVRKRFQRSRLHIGVADCADRTFRI